LCTRDSQSISGCLKATFSLAIRNKKADSNPVKTVRFLKENNLRVRWVERG